jgi:hypothetical protein
MFFAYSKLCSINSIISSTYWMIKMPSSTKFGITPEKWPSTLALLIRIVNISTTILNRIVDKWSPYQTFFVSKFWSTVSLIFMSTWPPSMEDATHLYHVWEKHFIRKICCTKDQLILSCVFSKSILNIIPFCFSYASYVTQSLPSLYFFPTKKSRLRWTNGLLSYVGDSISSYFKILKLTINKHMSLYCWIFFIASLHLVVI